MPGLLAATIVVPDFGGGGLVPDPHAPEQTLLWLAMGVALLAAMAVRRLRGLPLAPPARTQA